ncbi:hypothetical protein DIPPA_29033 [Diplonema papillatum]|nr:hypothetical protein DIPPA_29033 [Diplonema papillatum]
MQMGATAPIRGNAAPLTGTRLTTRAKLAVQTKSVSAAQEIEGNLRERHASGDIVERAKETAIILWVSSSVGYNSIYWDATLADLKALLRESAVRDISMLVAAFYWYKHADTERVLRAAWDELVNNRSPSEWEEGPTGVFRVAFELKCDSVVRGIAARFKDMRLKHVLDATKLAQVVKSPSHRALLELAAEQVTRRGWYDPLFVEKIEVSDNRTMWGFKVSRLVKPSRFTGADTGIFAYAHLFSTHPHALHLALERFASLASRLRTLSRLDAVLAVFTSIDSKLDLYHLQQLVPPIDNLSDLSAFMYRLAMLGPIPPVYHRALPTVLRRYFDIPAASEDPALSTPSASSTLGKDITRCAVLPSSSVLRNPASLLLDISRVGIALQGKNGCGLLFRCLMATLKRCGLAGAEEEALVNVTRLLLAIDRVLGYSVKEAASLVLHEELALRDPTAFSVRSLRHFERSASFDARAVVDSMHLPSIRSDDVVDLLTMDAVQSSPDVEARVRREMASRDLDRLRDRKIYLLCSTAAATAWRDSQLFDKLSFAIRKRKAFPRSLLAGIAVAFSQASVRPPCRIVL